jgi:biotin carboxyl carrier protein
MTAVMPGRVLSVNVSVGDAVRRGDLICVIEAMKMEQQIGASKDGTISAVHVSGGDSVAHGQILVEFE